MNAFDDAWDRALDAGLCRDAAADYAYDVWAGNAPPPVQPSVSALDAAYLAEQGMDPPPPRRVSDGWLEENYGDVCARRSRT